jgi:F-type H+-transporting ATPase subunit a
MNLPNIYRCFSRIEREFFGGYMIRLLGLILLAVFSTNAYASGGIVNWHEELYRLLSGAEFAPKAAERFVVIAGGIFTLIVCAVLGLFYKKSIKAAGDDLVPDGKFSLRTVLDMAMDLVVGMAKDNLGHDWKTYSPLLAGLFMYIVVCNLGGLIPGFIPATESLSNNLAMGLMVFFIYNFAGFKEHGFHYLKQFTGPMLAIAPLMLVIELIGHTFRPVSLSLRLMGNIFADHLLVGIFTANAPYVLVPSALMFFGLLVALIQSFVFTLLTSIYISLAVSHDH